MNYYNCVRFREFVNFSYLHRSSSLNMEIQSNCLWGRPGRWTRGMDDKHRARRSFHRLSHIALEKWMDNLPLRLWYLLFSFKLGNKFYGEHAFVLQLLSKFLQMKNYTIQINVIHYKWKRSYIAAFAMP